jgi:hypothetical protein
MAKQAFIFGTFGFLAGITELTVAYSAGKEIVDGAVIKLEQLNMIVSKLEKEEVSPNLLTMFGAIIDRPGVEKVLAVISPAKNLLTKNLILLLIYIKGILLSKFTLQKGSDDESARASSKKPAFHLESRIGNPMHEVSTSNTTTERTSFLDESK